MTEELAKRTTDCKDVDVDLGEGSVECDGMEMRIDDDGNVLLPERFPPELEPPTDADLVAAWRTEDGGDEVLITTTAHDGEQAVVADEVEEAVTAAGYTWEAVDPPDAEPGELTFYGEGASGDVVVTVHPDDNEGKSLVTLAVGLRN